MQPLAEQQRLTRAAADDFGHLVHRVPETVLAPATAADVAAGIASAARDGRTFAPRGQGHSTFGRAQADVVAAMAGLRGIGAVEDDRAIAARVRAAGGTVYPVGALPLSAAEWREHFGEAFGPLAEAKARFDPGRVLTPGYEVFG